MNLALHTIGQQLDRIEEKVEKPDPIPLVLTTDQPKKIIEKPLIILPESRAKIDFKNPQAKTLDKIDQMLNDLKKEQPSTSALSNKEIEEEVLVETTDESSNDHSSEEKDLDLLEKNFQDIVLKPEIARFSSKGPKPMSLTKNWYSRPTPPDLQFEEKVFQSQSSYSADKVYEWNIDGFSEQEIMNTMSKMSLVANAYVNNNIRQPDIVKILTQGFSGVLRNWWDKHLTRDAKETIQNAVKCNDEGLPIFDESIGSAQSDGVNTLI